MPVKRRLKLIVLGALKMVGMFRLARWLTRRRLRILCYHAISVGDQHQYGPILFMRESVFASRVRLLERMRVRVVSLDDAVKSLQAGTISRAETVITIDDGWATTYTVAAPILKRAGFPATLYVASRYVENPLDVYAVTVNYMVHASSEDRFALHGVHPALDGEYQRRDNVDATVARLIEAGEKYLSLEQQQQMLPQLAARLGIDFGRISQDRGFRYMTPQEAGSLEQFGISAELHTHRHLMPTESLDALRTELDANREAIRRMTGTEAVHFCYPSGKYASQHPAWLEACGVVSATTCEAGMNRPGTNPYLLRRHLDRDDASDLEFEAEVSGIFELWRMARGLD